MSANVIRAEYGKLRAISQSFYVESEQTKRLLDGIEAQVMVLKRGRWEAESATEFFRSMDAEVLPALHRLLTAFDHAGDLMLDIIAVYQRAERDALAVLPKTIEGIIAGGGGSSSLLDDLSDWVIANKETWKTLGDIMDVVPAKVAAVAVASVLGTPATGIAVAAVLFGAETTFTFLEHYDENPGWRGAAIATLDTGIGSTIGAIPKGVGTVWKGITIANGALQLTGNHGSGVIGWMGDTLNLDPQLVHGAQNLANQLGAITEQVDVGDMTYAGSQWIIDKAVGRDPAGAVERNGFDGFEKMSTSLGINGGAANFNARPKLPPLAQGAPLLDTGSLDGLAFSADTRAAFVERARAFTAYSADHLSATARYENTPRMAFSAGGKP